MTNTSSEKTLSVSEVRRVLSYDPLTGCFMWVVRPSNFVKMETEAGRITPNGYRRITVFGREYYAHRLAWFWCFGEWPPEFLDHINGDTLDNRILNLRPASNSQNQGNSSKQINNKTGYKGVSYKKKDKRFQATIRHDGKTVFLGLFTHAEQAHEAYLSAAKRIFGEFHFGGER